MEITPVASILARRAVSLRFILKAYNYALDRGYIHSHSSTSDWATGFLIPLTYDDHVSCAELFISLGMQPASAKIHIVHSWSGEARALVLGAAQAANAGNPEPEKLQDLLDETWYKGAKERHLDVCFFICPFSVNQHTVQRYTDSGPEVLHPDVHANCEIDKFPEVARTICSNPNHSMVLILDKDRRALTRSCCLEELHVAVTRGFNFSVHGAFDLRDASVDAARSEAHLAEMQRKILERISVDPGFDDFNEKVRTRLQEEISSSRKRFRDMCQLSSAVLVTERAAGVLNHDDQEEQGDTEEGAAAAASARPAGQRPTNQQTFFAFITLSGVSYEVLRSISRAGQLCCQAVRKAVVSIIENQLKNMRILMGPGSTKVLLEIDIFDHASPDVAWFLLDVATMTGHLQTLISSGIRQFWSETFEVQMYGLDYKIRAEWQCCNWEPLQLANVAPMALQHQAGSLCATSPHGSKSDKETPGGSPSTASPDDSKLDKILSAVKDMSDKLEALDGRIRAMESSSKSNSVWNMEVHFVYANPFQFCIAIDDKNNRTWSHPLKIKDEAASLHNSGAIVCLTCATMENLRRLKKSWTGEQVLHISCHGALSTNQEFQFCLEKPSGEAEFVNCETFLDNIMDPGHAPKICVINACNSKEVAQQFLKRGVQRVVAVDGEVLDTAANIFAKLLYHEFRLAGTEDEAFNKAINAVYQKHKKVAFKFKMVKPDRVQEFELGYAPAGLDPYLDKDIGVRFQGVIDDTFVPLLSPPKNTQLQKPYQCYPEQEQQMREILDHFSKDNNPARVVTLNGEPGSGKKTLATQLVRFASFPGGRFFSGGAVILSPSNVITQSQMKEKFGQKIMQDGLEASKEGHWRVARPARRGESIPKVEDGETKSRVDVHDDTSWVIRQESVDRELYVLRDEQFKKVYKTPGTPISEAPDNIFNNDKGIRVTKAERSELEKRGYQCFERQGKLLVYFVTAADMKGFVGDAGEFDFPFSAIPLKFTVDTPLVTPYVDNEADMQEIYVSANAKQIYDLKPRAPPSGGSSKPKKGLSEGSSGAEKARETKQESPLVSFNAVLDDEACKMAELADDWYKRVEDESKKLQKKTTAPKLNDFLASWISKIPQTAHCLCVLFGGEKYLAHEDCRERLLGLLRAHENLCLLITVQEKPGTDGEKLRLNQHHQQEFKEVPHRMRGLAHPSAAKFFHEKVNRKAFRWSDFGENPQSYGIDAAPAEVIPLEELLKILARCPMITECRGWPGKIVAAAEGHLRVKKLDGKLSEATSSSNATVKNDTANKSGQLVNSKGKGRGKGKGKGKPKKDKEIWVPKHAEPG